MTKLKKSKKPSSELFKCPYCDKAYKIQRYLVTHVCKQKKRSFERDTKPVRLAFHAYVKFFKIHYNKDVPYEHFANSVFYDAFVKFGKYILDVDAISPSDYIDYMLTSQIPIDKWCRDSEYFKYVKSLTIKESPLRALERTVILMQEWAIKHNEQWQEFFRKVSKPLAVQWILNGRLSPWVMLNCQSGIEMLGKFSDEQKAIIAPSLNTNLWMGKFSRFPSELKDIKDTLEEEGL